MKYGNVAAIIEIFLCGYLTVALYSFVHTSECDRMRHGTPH